jgi:putative endonuclease
MFYNIKIGKLGQQIAVRFLKSKGFRVIDQNIYFRAGEIDILVEKDNILSFIEVKTRTNLKFGFPEEGVTDQKREHLEAAIDCYRAEYNINQECVLEIISVRLDLKNKKAYLKYFY